MRMNIYYLTFIAWRNNMASSHAVWTPDALPRLKMEYKQGVVMIQLLVLSCTVQLPVWLGLDLSSLICVDLRRDADAHMPCSRRTPQCHLASGCRARSKLPPFYSRLMRDPYRSKHPGITRSRPRCRSDLGLRPPSAGVQSSAAA